MQSAPHEIFGIKNCDTMKKTFAWFNNRSISFDFFDYKKQGTPPVLKKWVDQLGWETLVNMRGTTWRNLTPDERENINADKALKLMQQYPSLIRRPIVCHADKLVVGYDEQAFAALAE